MSSGCELSDKRKKPRFACNSSKINCEEGSIASNPILRSKTSILPSGRIVLI